MLGNIPKYTISKLTKESLKVVKQLFRLLKINISQVLIQVKISLLFILSFSFCSLKITMMQRCPLHLCCHSCDLDKSCITTIWQCSNLWLVLDKQLSVQTHIINMTSWSKSISPHLPYMAKGLWTLDTCMCVLSDPIPDLVPLFWESFGNFHYF